MVSSPSFLFYIKEKKISTKVEYTQVLFSLPEQAFHRGSGLTDLKSVSSLHLQFQRPNRKGGGGSLAKGGYPLPSVVLQARMLMV